MSPAQPAGRVVGVVPWLPWPLSAWRWWTAPVRAERLAALRIGLAGCLLLDIFLTYVPQVYTFFSNDQLGDPAVFGWLYAAPRMTFSLLRGVGDPLVSFLALVVWLGTTFWIFTDLLTRAVRGNGARERDPLRLSVPLWCAAGGVLVAGIWSRLGHEGELAYAWLAPPVLVAWASVFLALELLRYLRRDSAVDRGALALLLLACVWTAGLAGAGCYFSTFERFEPGSIWDRGLGPWQNDRALLAGAMGAWIVATFLLLMGWWTRPAAIATWLLSTSFANVNSSVDNAGDTIRGILLFYLMLCPCGAAWSIDRLWRRWRGHDAPVLLVAPWAIRLIFVQMVFIYCCNGLYKLYGETWRNGESLYFVLGDFTLSRISLADCPLPAWMLSLMTWSVLGWEATFPLMAFNRWTRAIALVFGACFHLGIFFSMELGFFVPYALCMYLPFLPWDWLLARRHAALPPPQAAGPNRSVSDAEIAALAPAIPR